MFSTVIILTRTLLLVTFLSTLSVISASASATIFTIRNLPNIISCLSLENEIITYKTVLKPVWTYGIELWGCASNSNIEIIQRYQSEILRILTNASWYVTNNTLHSDLHIPYVREVFQERIAIHRTAISSHPNPLMAPLLHLQTTRRLKRRWTLDGTH